MGSLHSAVSFRQLFNMKSMILIAVFLAVAAAAPLEESAPIILIKSQTQNHDTEKQEYSFSYEAENGISVSESGKQKQFGDKPEEAGIISQGKFSYPEEGVTTPSPGLPMRTVSRPPVTTCPLPHPCPSTSSRCWLTWEPLANCKLIKPITNQMPSLFNHPSF